MADNGVRLIPLELVENLINSCTWKFLFENLLIMKIGYRRAVNPYIRSSLNTKTFLEKSMLIRSMVMVIFRDSRYGSRQKPER